MFKKSKSDSKSYGIIGLGRFGSALAVELAKSGAEPLVIDGNEEKVREMREYTENAFVVNSFLIIHLVSRKKDLRQNRSAKGLASFTANAANVRCQHSSCAVGDSRMGNP